MKKHISAGGVLFNPANKKYYLIYKKERKEWTLPKGHIEEDESKKESAFREVQEETGYENIEIVEEKPFLDKIEYDFKEKGEKAHKMVYFYLFILSNGDFKETPERKTEGLSGEWVSYEKGMNLLEYDNYKEILTKAKNIINNRKDRDLPLLGLGRKTR